jgi:hypothetical protein
MVEPWDGVGEVAMTETHKAQEGTSGGVRCSHWWLNLSGYVIS